MNNNGIKLSVVICVLLISSNTFAEPVAAGGLEKLSETQRIQRLEKILDSDVLREQTQTIQSLREEISALVEQIELQSYELESMKQRQRNLYFDMDRRLNDVEAGGRQGNATISPVPPPNTTATITPTASDNSDDGRAAYAKAFSLIKEGQYEQSITAFESFKGNYPDSKYADNAQYWLGEANLASRDYKNALQEFQQLISQYPDSSKNPGAHLKIGYVYYELKNWSAARDALQKVIALYPDTTVAKKANDRLLRMKREGK